MPGSTLASASAGRRQTRPGNNLPSSPLPDPRRTHLLPFPSLLPLPSPSPRPPPPPPPSLLSSLCFPFPCFRLDGDLECKAFLCGALASLLNIELHVIEMDEEMRAKSRVFNEGGGTVMGLFAGGGGQFHVVRNVPNEPTAPRRPVCGGSYPRISRLFSFT